MSDKKKEPQIEDTKKKEQLDDKELDKVSGGFNPQPEPPGDGGGIVYRKAGG